MNFFRTCVVSIALTYGSTLPLAAQVVPIETASGYEIARIVSADVCFAVGDFKSENGHDMVISYYRARTGQRWQVAGYLSAEDHPEESDTVSIVIDGKKSLTRVVEIREGDFIVPFESLEELEAFERDVENGTMLTFELEQDSFNIELESYRSAIGATIACVDAIE
ncbi:MAG: hypothetical protein P8L68_00915 [Paracoccaceae bacterium]|nr:hypothetical protein [Paracoccaceae bacterium]